MQQDYENMAKEKDAQKDVEKQLRTEVKKLKTMSLSLDEDQEKLFRAKEAIGKCEFLSAESFSSVLQVLSSKGDGGGEKSLTRFCEPRLEAETCQQRRIPVQGVAGESA